MGAGEVGSHLARSLSQQGHNVAVEYLAGGKVQLRKDTYEHAGRTLLDAAFRAVSITTTTGFMTADFDVWPALSRLLLVGLMFVGGCAGSTQNFAFFSSWDKLLMTVLMWLGRFEIYTFAAIFTRAFWRT